ncbi:MAG: YvcK family protein, partial [Propionibacteriaceae bacterium]|nr:YvcK family protein [Propionibacteriaceae bacterium]
LQSIRAADYLVLGPGSWYSSVIPHVLVPELLEAIESSRATRILTLNLVPTDDETPAYTASRHIEVLAEHAPNLRLDVVLADPTFAREDQHLAAYVAALGARLVVAPVRMRDGSPRHDPHLLASVYAGIMGL